MFVYKKSPVEGQLSSYLGWVWIDPGGCDQLMQQSKEKCVYRLYIYNSDIPLCLIVFKVYMLLKLYFTSDFTIDIKYLISKLLFIKSILTHTAL